MAFRRQRSRRGNNRSEKSRLPKPSSPFPSISPPSYTEEQELDERLTTFEVIARLQRKRYRIEVLKRDEDLDKPTDSERRSISFRQYKSDVWSKLQLFILKYKDQL